MTVHWILRVPREWTINKDVSSSFSWSYAHLPEYQSINPAPVAHSFFLLFCDGYKCSHVPLCSKGPVYLTRWLCLYQVTSVCTRWPRLPRPATPSGARPCLLLHDLAGLYGPLSRTRTGLHRGTRDWLPLLPRQAVLGVAGHPALWPVVCRIPAADLWWRR